jgi:type 1 fimbria pilin
MDIKRWEIKYKAFSEAEERRAKAMAQAFEIVLGQCSPTVIDRIKVNSQYSAISDSDDVIQLLRLIRTSMYTGDTSKNEMHSLIDALPSSTLSDNNPPECPMPTTFESSRPMLMLLNI